MNREQMPGIIIGKLLNIGGMLQRHGNTMLMPYNLNQQQFSIFFEIAQAGKVKQKDVVNRLLLEKPHVSKVVKKLQHMQLITVTETEEDKRSCWLSLTQKGENVLAQCTEMFRDWNQTWICELDETRLASILDNLTTLQTIFKEKTQ